MGWFWKRRKPDQAPAAEDQAVAELLDPYHDRSAIRDGDQLVINASQAIENIALAMERLDLDINTPVSINEDVIPVPVLSAMIGSMGQGQGLALHVVNTGLRILTARYPAKLARLPLPEGYDLRQMHPLELTDAQHEIARNLFNRRSASPQDLEWGDAPEVEDLPIPDQAQVFVALFFMFASKSGAIQWRLANPN